MMLFLVEDPHDNALPMEYGDGGDPEVYLPISDHEPYAAVLRQPPLGDVQLRHNLDP